MEEETRTRTLFPLVDPDMPVSEVWELVGGLMAQGIVVASNFGFFRLAELQGVRHVTEPIGTALTPKTYLERDESPGVAITAESINPIIVGQATVDGIEMVWTLDPNAFRLPPSRWVCLEYGHSVSPYPDDGLCPDHGLPLTEAR